MTKIEDLLHIWQMTDCTVTCRDPQGAFTRRDNLHRFRGAVGRVLGDAASPAALAGQPCTFDPPCAFDVFHNSQGRLRAGYDIPKPFVLRSDQSGEEITLTLRLFGQATRWEQSFQQAVIAAARRGLDTKAGRHPLEVLHAETRPAGLSDPLVRDVLELSTVTPLVLRGAGEGRAGARGEVTAKEIAPAIFSGVLARVAGLAHWHDPAMAISMEALRQELHDLAPRAKGGFDVQGATRGRGRGRLTYSGQMHLPDPSPELTRALSMAEAAGLGADTTAGFGRVTIL